MYSRLMFILISGCLFMACQSSQKQQDDLLTIDVTKSYPAKEILLSDIANISYVQLDDTNDDFLYGGQILRASDDNIVVFNSLEGDILFFSKEGKPKSRFNRKGNGPGEYVDVVRRLSWYDDENDDLYIKNRTNVDVLSSAGEYKRSFPVREDLDVTEMFLAPDKTMLFFDMSAQMKYIYQYFLILKYGKEEAEAKETKEWPRPFFAQFDSKDGKELSPIYLPTDYRINLTISGSNSISIFVKNAKMEHIVKHPEGILLHTQETDTVYLYNFTRKDLTPVMVQTPSLPTLSEPIYLNSFIETSNYKFIELIKQDKEKGDYISTHLVYDKAHGGIYKQSIVFDDYPDKEFFIETSYASATQNASEIYIELPVEELRSAYEKGQLKGKLKDMVVTMNEDAENNVLVFMKFK